MLRVIFAAHSKSRVDKETLALTFATERTDNYIRQTKKSPSHGDDPIHLQRIPGGSHILEGGDFDLKRSFWEICDKIQGSVANNFVKATKEKVDHFHTVSFSF